MRKFQIQLFMFIVFARFASAEAAPTSAPTLAGNTTVRSITSASVVALDANAPPLAPPARPALQASDTKKLPNLENNDKLWALLQYESKYGKIEYTSLRKFGDYSNTNLRAVKAVGFNLSEFNFKNADLRGADLRQANLRGADFSGADLRETVLLSTNTQGALFNQRTLFPFSREEALKRGWKEITH